MNEWCQIPRTIPSPYMFKTSIWTHRARAILVIISQGFATYVILHNIQHNNVIQCTFSTAGCSDVWILDPLNPVKPELPSQPLLASPTHQQDSCTSLLARRSITTLLSRSSEVPTFIQSASILPSPNVTLRPFIRDQFGKTH